MQENYRPHYANSWALIIGINDYLHAAPLEIARADAESVAHVLTSDLGFLEANVIKLLDADATRAEIMKRFLAFESLAPDDRLLVFFAGHGITVDGQRRPMGYLVPVDGRVNDKSILIRWQELTDNAEIIPAKHVLFIMDACYSGLAIQRATAIGERRFLREMLQPRSRQVITAGKTDQPVADGGGPTGHNSIFTGHMLEGLRGKAADESGVLTASHLMDYVYRKVSSDARSNQTPHFGHLDGEGDFILRTPNDEHLTGANSADFLLKPVIERPEPSSAVPSVTIKPKFAEHNGYADPENERFGQNEWSRRLGALQASSGGGAKVISASSWIALVVEPVSSEPIRLDLVALAKSLPHSPVKGDRPYEHFRFPTESRTTAKSLILYDSISGSEGADADRWKRFLRIENGGAIEYCESWGVSRLWSNDGGGTWLKLFKYVQSIGIIWNFLAAAKRILDLASYQAGVRFLVNFVGTKDSLLFQFSPKPGKDDQHWRDPFDHNSAFGGSLTTWRCHDQNLQIPFQLVLGSLDEAEGKKVIVECADQLGLAFNHQSSPRCFNYGTEEYPWDQYDPYNR